MSAFQNVGEDSGNEGNKERKCPKPGLGLHAGGDHDKERQRDKQGCSVAEIARRFHDQIKR